MSIKLEQIKLDWKYLNSMFAQINLLTIDHVRNCYLVREFGMQPVIKLNFEGKTLITLHQDNEIRLTDYYWEGHYPYLPDLYRVIRRARRILNIIIGVTFNEYGRVGIRNKSRLVWGGRNENRMNFPIAITYTSKDEGGYILDVNQI